MAILSLKGGSRKITWHNKPCSDTKQMLKCRRKKKNKNPKTSQKEEDKQCIFIDHQKYT